MAIDDPAHIRHIPSRRLFAENVQASVEAGDCGIRVQIIGQADEQHVEGLGFEKAIVGRVVADAVFERPLAAKHAIADGNRAHVVPRVDHLAAAFADDAVAGDADAQGFAHVSAPSGEGVR